MVGLHISFEGYQIQSEIGPDPIWNMYSFKFKKIYVKTLLFSTLVGFYKSSIKLRPNFFLREQLLWM